MLKKRKKILSGIGLLFFLILMTGLIPFFSYAQNQNTEYIDAQSDTTSNSMSDSNPLFSDSMSTYYQNKGIAKKLITGTLISSQYNLFIGTSLAVGPETVSKWEDKMQKLKLKAIARQYKKSFSTPPIFDKDLFIINYIGHPYQGSFYYNSLRSQNACVLHSALFCMGNSLLWEYGWEAGLEQPSIQDLISTPLAGILLGELTHKATIKMSENGFCWYEVVLVCILNPAYVINNGFKLKRTSKKHTFAKFEK